MRSGRAAPTCSRVSRARRFDAAGVRRGGLYAVGDAVQLFDPLDPRQGLRFAGRLSENFKLSNGSWVLTGELRAAVLAAAPGVAELVVAGHDRDDVRLLVWPARGNDPAEVQAGIVRDLAAYNAANPGATRRVAGFLPVDAPPSMADGELTDKGYVNQLFVLANRADLVARLYGDPGSL